MNVRIYFISACIIIAIAVLVFYFKNNEHVHNDQKKLTIVCTTSIIADAVSFICQENATVHALMGPGIDPHLYTARSHDIQKLSDADIIFYNGLHLEGKMSVIFQSLMQQKTVIAVSDGVPTDLLRPCEYENMFDPHIWHDVSLWSYVVQYIADIIIASDGQHALQYADRVLQYRKKLSLLHVWVQESINKIEPKKRILVTAHDAFGYFGKQYGLQVVGLQGLSTDSSVGAKDIIQFVNFIIEHAVPALFIESSISERNIIAVTQAVQARGNTIIIGKELFSDALGDSGTGAHTYCGMIEHNVIAIVQALSSHAAQEIV